MQRNITRALFVGAAFVLSMSANAPAETQATPVIVSQATPAPSPKPTATPNPFTYGGYLRSYYFTRLNNPQLTTKNALNQATLNQAISAHAAYSFGDFSVGATYLYAVPFAGDCNTPASHLAGPPCVKKNTGALIQGTNPDDTVPGFILNTLYEAYIQYKSPELYGKIGNQVINFPWAPNSDSRLKPAAFQGGDFIYNLDKNWSVEAAYMNKWESRVDSNFLNSTLLTATNIADAPGAGSNLHIPPFSAITTPGFYFANVGYTKGGLSAFLGDYSYVNIANALWLYGTYNFQGVAMHPFLAGQFGYETNAGSAVIGKINSQVFGVQGGITPWNNVTFTVGYDYLPQKTDTLTLPAGVTCPTTTIGGTAVFSYFLPSGGTPQCHKNANGTTNIYYGGWASPYSDSYATDPLYTTSISQGMVDRRSPGQSVKVAATVYLYQKRVRFIASRAYYDYGNGTGGVAPTQESDLDGTFFFNHVGKGAYKGLSFRYRYAERTQNFFTTNPDFKYNRAQLEYDF